MNGRTRRHVDDTLYIIVTFLFLILMFYVGDKHGLILLTVNKHEISPTSCLCKKQIGKKEGCDFDNNKLLQY